MNGEVLLEVRDLRKYYPTRPGLFGGVGAKVHAVDGVSFAIAGGETLGLVGESGCGKSTTGKLILRLQDPTSGSILWRGRDISRLGAAEMRPVAARAAGGVPGPYSSLNPRIRAADIVAEPLRNFEDMSSATGADRMRSCSSGSPARRPDGQVSVRVLRRPAAAAGHRPRPFRAAEADRLRRAGLGARRLGAGAGDQTADGPAAGDAPCRICSSRTTWRWSSTSATGGGECTSARSSRSRRRRRSLSARSTRTPRRCWRRCGAEPEGAQAAARADRRRA